MATAWLAMHLKNEELLRFADAFNETFKSGKIIAKKASRTLYSAPYYALKFKSWHGAATTTVRDEKLYIALDSLAQNITHNLPLSSSDDTNRTHSKNFLKIADDLRMLSKLINPLFSAAKELTKLYKTKKIDRKI